MASGYAGETGEAHALLGSIDHLIKTTRSTSPTSDANEPTLGAFSRSALNDSMGDDSIVSRRAELDNAVERGDWQAVKRLTTQMLDTTSPSPVRRDRYKILTEADRLSDTLMMVNTESPAKSTPMGSPFRATPSSFEWSQSPVDREKTEKIHRLINAGDWKGVHVLSCLFEMEANKTLPQTIASISADSAEGAAAFAQGWLGGAGGALPDMQDTLAAPPPPARPPPSPTTSTSTGASVDLREFERLVNAKDWRGLAAFGAEEGEDNDEEAVMCNLFDTPLVPPSETNELDQVELRQVGEPAQKVVKNEIVGRKVSLHGAQESIPYWQEFMDKNSPDEKDTKPSRKEEEK